MKDIFISLIFFMFLFIIMPPRKTKQCKTIRGQKVCNHKPKMNAAEIISLQMNALKKNNRYDNGIKVAYQYASPDNKSATGPYSRFNQMVKNDIYKHLLRFKRWSFVKNSIQKTKDEKYSRLVKVKSSYDNNEYIYRFQLSRQIPSLFWRTDSVELIEGFDHHHQQHHYKEHHHQQKNIYNRPLQSCSMDPLTGYHRRGYCFTDDNDKGTHTVCAKVNDEFLEYTKGMGNDLSTKNDEYNFPGLKENDNWCLCALRWKQALKAGKAPPLDLEATNLKTLDYIDLDTLENNKI